MRERQWQWSVIIFTRTHVRKSHLSSRPCVKQFSLGQMCTPHNHTYSRVKRREHHSQWNKEAEKKKKKKRRRSKRNLLFSSSSQKAIYEENSLNKSALLFCSIKSTFITIFSIYIYIYIYFSLPFPSLSLSHSPSLYYAIFPLSPCEMVSFLLLSNYTWMPPSLFRATYIHTHLVYFTFHSF